MHLKNLTVLGFKSFADKTALDFEPGITAIVGPNGCGKSNVADAIRWVLGEQSAKALRGGEMADVIFNGTDSRKALGLAEVSLTISDIDEDQLTAAGVDITFNEVTVTRRVFRDGGSEYFINKVPCRLKDIQQLFMGTGVGRASYSIMAQGNITQILSSRPEDRRLVFEEAAGITKYKAQKREALRKLDHTEQNLLRVDDMIREVKRQIGSLQRQAGKARRFKQAQAELQHLETQLARHEFDSLQGRIGERKASAERLRDEMEECSESVLKLEDEILQLRDRMVSLEQEINVSQQKGLELRAEIERNDGRIQFNESRINEFNERQESWTRETAEAEDRRSAATDELEAVIEELRVARESLTAREATANEKREALNGIESSLREVQEAVRVAQSEAFSLSQDLSRARNEVNSLDLQKQGNVVRLEKLSSEKIQLEQERVQLDERLQSFEADMAAERSDAESRRGSVEERRERLGALHGEVAQATEQLDELLKTQAEKRSKLGVLEQLVASHEGFSEGAQAALREANSVLGSLADKIRVPDRYVAAVEAVLGQRLQIVLIDEPGSAREILERLQSNRLGRASIASLGLLRSLTTDSGIADGSGSGVGDAGAMIEGCVAAGSVVEMDESVRPLIQALLRDTFIVPDLAAATGLWRERRGTVACVTERGELLSREGIYTGGAASGSDKNATSILARKNLIEELRADLDSLLQRIDEASRRKGSLASERTALEAGLQEAQTELKQKEVAIATQEGEFNALTNSRRVLEQKIETVVFEVQSLAAQEREGLDKREALASRLSELEGAEQAASARLDELNERQEELRRNRDEANTVLTETKVALASEQEVCVGLDRRQAPLRQRLSELAQLIENRRDELESLGRRRDECGVEIAECRATVERLRHERDQVAAQTAELVGRRGHQEAEVQSREEGLRERRSRLNEIQTKRGELDVEIAQKSMTAENLCNRIHEKYQVDLRDVRSETITITFADDGPAKVHTVTPEEMEQTGVATDWEAVAEQVDALQKKLDSMGPVNLVAIEEYEETEQRYQFLTTQYEDLVKAKEELHEVINRINTQTRRMFIETFEKIRANFKAMFEEIFGGGTADLRLTDDEDVLESGIEIVARPPGKKLQSISLLSGGEQTMTAVSLLFSIYQVKPSPFCVLDELDAPLDESNINRFIKVLKRFLENSQFVIITHNKRTISTANVLYGVTMQERGVSRIVSVKFTEEEEGEPKTRNRESRARSLGEDDESDGQDDAEPDLGVSRRGSDVALMTE